MKTLVPMACFGRCLWELPLTAFYLGAGARCAFPTLVLDPLSLMVPKAWQGHPGAPAALKTCWSLLIRVLKHGLMNIKDGVLVVLFLSSTAVGLIRCSQGFIEAYKMYVCFHRQRLWLCKSKQCHSAQYFLVQFSGALDGPHSASLERKMVWWCCVCFFKWKRLCR